MRDISNYLSVLRNENQNRPSGLPRKSLDRHLAIVIRIWPNQLISQAQNKNEPVREPINRTNSENAQKQCEQTERYSIFFPNETESFNRKSIEWQRQSFVQQTRR